MSTPALPYADLRAFVKGAASLPEKDDGGKPVTEGSHANANAADAKKVVKEVGIESGKDNPVTGTADKPISNSGLKQTTVGKMPEVEDAVKIVSHEAAKAASADLTDDAQFDAAVASLRKAAAEFPALAAAWGLKVEPVTPSIAAPTKLATETPAAPVKDAAAEAKASVDGQVAALVDTYRKYGADYGHLTACALKGFYGVTEQLEKMAADGTLHAILYPKQAEEEGAPAAPVPDATASPEGAEAAMPPAAEAAPAPAPAPGGGGAPGQDSAPSLEDVAAALTEMGMTPDQLMEVAQMMQGQAQSMPGPEAGGPPPEMKAAAVANMAVTVKTAADVKQLMRNGSFALKPAADGTPARARRNAAKGYIRELVAAAQ